MKIYQATIKQLDQVAFLFNQYRIFYRQPADLKSAFPLLFALIVITC